MTTLDLYPTEQHWRCRVTIDNASRMVKRTASIPRQANCAGIDAPVGGSVPLNSSWLAAWLA
jgi:hypothetical protein